MMARPFSADTLSQLRDLIEQDALRVPNKDAALAYLDLTEDALGREFHAGLYAKTQDAFETRFPEAPDEELATPFGDERLYQRWRRNVLKLLCFAGTADNTDLFRQLSLFARREGFEAPLRPVFNEVFPGRHPQEICREEALDVDRRLLGRDRQRFRRAIVLLDRLRAIDDVRNAGLLGPDPIGPFPLYRENSRERVKLPSGLAVLMEGQTGADARCVRRIFEIAVDAGILDEFSDIAPLDLTARSILRQIFEAVCTKTTKRSPAVAPRANSASSFSSFSRMSLFSAMGALRLTGSFNATRETRSSRLGLDVVARDFPSLFILAATRVILRPRQGRDHGAQAIPEMDVQARHARGRLRVARVRQGHSAAKVGQHRDPIRPSRRSGGCRRGRGCAR